MDKRNMLDEKELINVSGGEDINMNNLSPMSQMRGTNNGLTDNGTGQIKLFEINGSGTFIEDSDGLHR